MSRNEEPLLLTSRVAADQLRISLSMDMAPARWLTDIGDHLRKKLVTASILPGWMSTGMQSKPAPDRYSGRTCNKSSLWN